MIYTDILIADAYMHDVAAYDDVRVRSSSTVVGVVVVVVVCAYYILYTAKNSRPDDVFTRPAEKQKEIIYVRRKEKRSKPTTRKTKTYLSQQLFFLYIYQV